MNNFSYSTQITKVVLNHITRATTIKILIKNLINFNTVHGIWKLNIFDQKQNIPTQHEEHTEMNSIMTDRQSFELPRNEQV